DADLAALAQGFTQQGVDLLAALGGGEIVGCLVILGRYFASIDEALELERLRRLEVGLAKILVRQCNVLALLVLVAFDDVVPGAALAGAFVDSLVADRGEVAAVEQVQLEGSAARGRMQLHGNVDEAEGN